MAFDYISANARVLGHEACRSAAYARRMPQPTTHSVRPARPEHETLALCALARCNGLDADTFETALAQTGSLQALLDADAAALRKLGLRPAAARDLAARDHAALESDLCALERHSLQLLAAHEPGYPPQLRQIRDAPAVLFVRGATAVLGRAQLAVVGSRNPTATGERSAREFAYELAACGLVITSGLALGIDAASHEGALLGGGTTVAVCATGLDRTYPESHLELAERIAAAGALVSEFPPGTPPLPAHFPQRNRLISGLALGVLVVEAARRSGSLATARCAGEQGREIFAIPGSIHSPLSQGCHALIRQGAKLVENLDDILSEIQFTYKNQSVDGVRNPAEAPRTPSPRLDNPAEILLDALGFEPTSVDALIASTGLSSTSVASLLLHLEFEGRVDSDGFGRYFRVLAPRGGPTA